MSPNPSRPSATDPSATDPGPHPRPPQHAREVRRAEPAHREDLPTDLRGRVRVAHRALADRHGARSIVLGGSAGAVLGVLVLRRWWLG